MSTTGPTIEQLRIVLCVLPPFACVVTYFRLYVRGARGKLWWDDFWAFLSTLLTIVFVVAVMLHVRDPTTLSQNVKIAIYYMCAQFFYAVAWTARISILFTVVRLSFGTTRRILSIVAVFFFLAWLVLFSQVWWVCEREPGWKDQLSPQCTLGTDVAIAQVITDIISDAILIAAPVRLLWRAHLERGPKLRLIMVFLTTSMTTAVSLYHVYCLLRFGGVSEVMAATIQISISLLVANLAVVVAFIFRLRSDSETDNRQPISTMHTSGYGSRRPKRNQPWSTVGLTTTRHGAEDGVEVHVDIVRAGDGWAESESTPAVNSDGTEDYRKRFEEEGTEMKIVVSDHDDDGL